MYVKQVDGSPIDIQMFESVGGEERKIVPVEHPREVTLTFVIEDLDDESFLHNCIGAWLDAKRVKLTIAARKS
jgi:hypothetical protein